MKGFDEWLEGYLSLFSPEYEVRTDELKDAYRAGDEHGFKRGFNEGREIGKAEGMAEQKEIDAEIAEKLSDEFRDADQHKWPEMTEDRTQGAEAVEWAIRNQGNEDG